MTETQPPHSDRSPEERQSLENSQYAGSPRPPAGPTRRGMDLRQRASEFPGTFGLIGLTLSVFVLQLLSTQLIGGDLVLFFGAKEKALTAAGQWWRVITPLFIHVGLMHFFVNMYSLYILGPGVESFFGTLRFLSVYILAGIGGVLLSLLFSEGRSVGASGAIFGLLGAYGTFLYMHRETFGRVGSTQLRQLIFVAVMNLAIGLSPGIDNWGHLGGLITGSLLTFVLGPVYKSEYDEHGQSHLVDTRPWVSVRRSMALLGLAILGLTLIAAYV